MTDETHHTQPAREYYTAQELADLALEWGAIATLTDNDGSIVIELERHDHVLHLDLGRQSEFYSDMLCRGWVTVLSAPHRLCDRLNQFPYLGTFSVVYGENDMPDRTDGAFSVRAVKIIEFDRCTSRDDIFTQTLVFWHGLNLLQESIANGDEELLRINANSLSVGLTQWWFGNDDGSVGA